MNTWRNEKWAKDAPSELANDLDIIEYDDKKAPTLKEAVVEAHYILCLYSEGGTASSDALDSDDPGVRAEALRQIKLTKRFITKYTPKC